MNSVLDDITDPVMEAIRVWQTEHSDEKLKRIVYKTLNDQFETLIYGLIGFKKDWGKWGVNTKNSNSMNIIKTQSELIADQWLAEVKVPALTEEMKDSLQKHAKERARHIIIEKLDNELNDQADKLVREIIKEVAGLNRLAAINKMKQLINGDSQDGSNN